jgi:hypothetical protein
MNRKTTRSNPPKKKLRIKKRHTPKRGVPKLPLKMVGNPAWK